MRSRTANRVGIVIRRAVMPAGDVILTLLTPQGKVKGIARGGARGALMSRLNLFQHLAVQLYQTPNNDLATIQQATLEGALPRLSEPERYPLAHLLAELADALFQEGEHSEQAFELFAAALRGVAFQPDPEWVALVMSYKLLAFAGFVTRAERCARCGAADPTGLDALSGHVVCRACSNLPRLPDELLGFLRSVARTSVRGLMEVPLPREVRPAAWRALERFVTAQVGDVRSWRSLVSTQLPATA
ncbi:DNA repair protein RecO [Deinococcus maricopensis]|uniref:DNA repair protein RecO n=1 Tax=Deinococcus maricopensis (strain DSM 21211 / LMG 22137 / NRRL B-23946 / LB-34) TaxID=709986 RepID=E8UAL3_DEIML|nr:DNA repair protein RecO [Deinococcus maricopensis]ADV68102.1 DNA repair protein recO [Deinococcus maricopensis DSM 21211]